jgi:hypothetical protein
MSIVSLFVLALLGGMVSTASAAVEAPSYRVGGKALTNTREVFVAAEGDHVLKNATSKITITCTGLKAQTGALIVGSPFVGEPGTSSGVLEYTGCTTAGNGVKCELEAKTITTNALKDELAYAVKQEPLVKGNKIVDRFTPAAGAVLATLKFKPEAGGKCTFSETTVEGAILAETLNEKKESVAVGEHEVEEEFAFIKAISGEACKVAGGKFTGCSKASLKAFGTAATYEGTSQLTLATGEMWGVFSK